MSERLTRRYMELLDALAKYEDVIFDADGNEIISLARLRELAEAEREGRINISQYPNCGTCKRVTADMFAKREPCKSCKSRALAEKGDAT